MSEYRVIWEMDIDAASPREAAEKARETQVRTGTWAVVFDVTDPGGMTTRVDLLEGENEDYTLPSVAASHRQHMERSP